MFRCPNRIPSDPAAHHYLLIQQGKSAPAELLWALSQKLCQRRGWHIQCQRFHRPAQLSSAVPTQFSPTCAWSLHWGAVPQPLSFWDQGVGMWDSFCSKHRATQTPTGNQSWARIPVSAPRHCCNRGAWAPLPCRMDDYWFFSLSNPPISML